MLKKTIKYCGYTFLTVTVSYSALAGIPTVDLVGATGKLLDDLKAVSVTSWVQKEVEAVSNGQQANIVDFSYPCKIVYQIVSTKEVFRLIPESSKAEPVCAQEPYTPSAEPSPIASPGDTDLLKVPKDIARAYLFVGLVSFLGNVLLISVAVFRRISRRAQPDADLTTTGNTNE